MTWNEWCYYSNGLYRNKIKEWEHTRTIAWLIYKSSADPKKSAKNMQSWMPLSTDNRAQKTPRKKGKVLTKAQQQEFFKSQR